MIRLLDAPRIKDDEGKRDAKGVVSVGLVAMACEFPRSVTDDEGEVL